jgi:hypothetical protein
MTDAQAREWARTSLAVQIRQARTIDALRQIERDRAADLTADLRRAIQQRAQALGAQG